MTDENTYAIASKIARMNLSKAAHTLLGICAGLVADGKLNDAEIGFLDVWLHENQDITEVWPGSIIADRIREICADGIITDDERQSMLELLKNVSGNEFAETGAAAPGGPYAEFDINEKVLLDRRRVVLTGTFFFGSRRKCEDATAEAGAINIKDVTMDTDYLIVGSGCSTAWANTTYGRKIEKAIEYRKRNGKPLIVTEKQWMKAIGST